MFYSGVEQTSGVTENLPPIGPTEREKGRPRKNKEEIVLYREFGHEGFEVTRFLSRVLGRFDGRRLRCPGPTPDPQK